MPLPAAPAEPGTSQAKESCKRRRATCYIGATPQTGEHDVKEAAFSRVSASMICGSLVLLVFTSAGGCKQDATPAEKTKSLYLHNPWADQGAAPYFHGAANAWSLSPMQPFDCGWYRHNLVGGDFRFMMGDNWSHNELGPQGLCPPPDGCPTTSFNLDSMLDTVDEVWIWLDAKTGKSMIDTSRPFECSPTSEPLANPYGRGQLPSLARKSQAKDLLAVWKSRFYEESGSLARVKFDTATQTVSEGIAYGMLIFVFADDGSGAEQGSFDKLFAYYKKFDDGNGLMHWKVNGFDGVAEANAASDADLDVAVALLVAHKKWGEPKNDSRYLDAANELIAAIKSKELNGAGYLKPGDAWDAAKNPSYVSFVAFELFRKYDNDQAFWSDVIDRHYALLMAARNASTGLLPNWTDEKGVAANPGTGYPNWDAFGFDAIRVPWRLGWAYLWYGGDARHARARELALGFCNFFKGNLGGDVSKVRAEYSIDGSPIGATTPAGPGVVGAYAVACAVDPAQAASLDAAYAGAMGKTADYDVTYYQTSLKLLEVLLLTGQAMPIP